MYVVPNDKAETLHIYSAIGQQMLHGILTTFQHVIDRVDSGLSGPRHQANVFLECLGSHPILKVPRKGLPNELVLGDLRMHSLTTTFGPRLSLTDTSRLSSPNFALAATFSRLAIDHFRVIDVKSTTKMLIFDHQFHY